MQLTPLDRWLLETFVHETHVYTLSLPPNVPRGVVEVPLPNTPGQRFKHHFIGKGKNVDALIAGLKENGQMFSTHVTDRKGWHISLIAPKGKSFTWKMIWLAITCSGVGTVTLYAYQQWQKPEVRAILLDALEIMKG